MTRLRAWSKPGRVRVVIAATLMQAGLGTAYSWSVFRNPLAERFGWSLAEVSLTFSIMILTAGFGAFLGGLWLERAGPRRVAVASGVLYGVGIAMAGLAGERLALLYLGYGVVAGAGLGVGYIVPVATLVRRFPDRRGLMTGVAASSFAAGALAAVPLAARLVAALGPLDALVVLGVVVLVVIVMAGRLLPGPGEQLRRPAPGPALAVGRRAPADRELTLNQAVLTWRWYAVWAVFFLSVIAGMGFVAEAAPMAQELAGMEPVPASGLVGLLFVADVMGRLLWPWASDAVGRRTVLVSIFLGQAAAFAALTQASSPLGFGLLGALVIFLYGGSSGTVPALVADIFGTRALGAVYGSILTAWGFGGLVGPLLIAATRHQTGRYTSGLLAISVVMLAGAALVSVARESGHRVAR